MGWETSDINGWCVSSSLIVETMSQNILHKLSHLTHLKPELASNFENIENKKKIKKHYEQSSSWQDLPKMIIKRKNVCQVDFKCLSLSHGLLEIISLWAILQPAHRGWLIYFGLDLFISVNVKDKFTWETKSEHREEDISKAIDRRFTSKRR